MALYSTIHQTTVRFLVTFFLVTCSFSYVLVLGLDIIGNPFGLIRDLQSGFQGLFYEPYKGAIQGPEEFAEGLALGVKGLFTHTVGGTAGSFIFIF